MVEIQGRFNLDKELSDGRRSPMVLLPPDNEDVLIIDQHTDENDIVQYTKTVGVMKHAVNEDNRFIFDWTVTDPGLKALVESAKHPEKLFKYSPEFKAVNKTEKHDQGEIGKLKHIAITNRANDTDAITTKIYDMVKNMVELVKNGSTVALNTKCAASGLINAGKINRSSPWNFTEEDRKREPITSFLGIDQSKKVDNPSRKKYPVIKNGQVYLSGLKAAASRGGQNAPAIGAKASQLYQKAKSKGDKMEKNEIQDTVMGAIQPIIERLEAVEKVSEALKDFDYAKLQETLDDLKKIVPKVDDIEKNMAKIEKEELEEREKLIKNIKTNGGLDEEDLKKMSTRSLEALNIKFHKEPSGAGEGGDGAQRTIVDEINEEFGMDIGKNIKGDS